MGEPVRSLPRRAAEPPRRPASPERAPRQKSAVREYAEALVVALGLALFIRTFFIQAYKIPSGSMEPTLLIGDHILVNKLAYGLRMPDSLLGFHPPGIPYGHYVLNWSAIHAGDIVVFVFPPDPTKDFIKRVVAVGGDTVELRGHSLYVNNVKQEDPHAYYLPAPEGSMIATPHSNYGPVKVPDGKILVMGDNRDRSYDSRFWGFVDRDRVEGNALVIYWSWDGDSSSLFPVRFSRIGRVVE